MTHPGLKVGVNYQLKSWEKTKINKRGNEKVIQREIDLCPSLGLFYHKDYQTGLFVLPELSYSKKNLKGNYMTFAIGTGYMRTLIPNVYDVNASGEIMRKHMGYNYLITDFSVSFGKDLSLKKKIPLSIYFKPQLIYAIPNYSKSIKYFALEIGLNYRLTKK